ncbi:MAG TPA: hypothetical protein VGK13_08100 [Methanocellaceae archaeon]
MFERLLRLFNRIKPEAPQRLLLSENAAAVRTETANALPAGEAIAAEQAPETKPDIFLLPSMDPEPAVVSKPAIERNFSMPLPSSISGEEVAMVQHSVNRTSSERFKYVEKPLKPLEKAEQKKPEDVNVIKYKLKPLNMQAPAEHKDTTRGDVIVYEKT